jgi:dipeptidyl-peptidase-4
MNIVRLGWWKVAYWAVIAVTFPVASIAQDLPGVPQDPSGFGQIARSKVFLAVVVPNWIGRTNRFCYRNEFPDGRRQYVLVDPAVPSKSPAFDQVKLAVALTKLLGKEVLPDRIPVERISFSDDKPEMLALVEDKTYAVDLQTYEVRPSNIPLSRPTPQTSRRFGGGGDNRVAGSTQSPDKKWQVILRDHNLILKDVASDQESPLTNDGKAEDRYDGRAYWSPDSTKVVVLKTVPAPEHKVYEVESSPKDQLQPKLRSFDYLKPGDNIERPRPHLFDVATRKDIHISDELFPNPWEITDIRWSTDSKDFNFLYNQRGHQIMRLISVDAETGIARTVIDEQARTFIDWTNKVYLHRLDGMREAIWMSERDGWNHLYLYDMTTGKVKNQITKGDWVVRGVDRVDDAKRQIWFRAGGIRPGQDPYYIHYCRINLDGTGLVMLTEGDGNHRVTFSPDNKYLIDSYSRVDLPTVTVVRGAQDGNKLLDLERGDASALLATGWKYPERFVTKARDGKTDIYGVIVRPTKFDPKRKYPIIENIYAGPQGSFVPKTFADRSQMQGLADLGFIVVQMDGMGTNNRSKAFHDVCWKNLGDAGFPDRILWIKAAAAKFPSMDLSRVGIYGTSAGGQSALGGLLQYPDFYRACVSDCGCHDNRMDKIWWNEQWMGWPIGSHYADQSNVTLAPKLKGKLLLMVGEMDNNVDPASTMQVVNALIKANKDFDLLVVPGAGHGVAGSPYGRRRLQDFFVRNLQGIEPPNRNAEQRTVGTEEEPRSAGAQFSRGN